MKYQPPSVERAELIATMEATIARLDRLGEMALRLAVEEDTLCDAAIADASGA